MKTRKIVGYIVSTIFVLCIQMALYAQAPQGFTYQAVVRNGSGSPIASQSIGLRVTLENASHIEYYTETHSTTSNAQGVISVNIGAGSQVGIKTFVDIPWENGDVFIKLEIDPTGGSSYTAMGEPTHLKSVPYALYAENAKEIVSNPNAAVDDPIFEVKNKLGQVVFGVYQGGVRVYVEDTQIKGAKGGFAVGGLTNQVKAGQAEYFRITPDSARVWVKEVPTVKGAKGGFAVGGLTNQGKTTSANFLNLTPENYFIGQEAGKSITTGLYNSFMGYQAGRANTGGQYNSFIGYNAGLSNTTGASNVFIGNESGKANLIGGNNVFLGFNAGLTSNASNNVFLGYQSGLNNTSGSDNVFIGTSSGYTNTTGASNVFLGFNAGYTNNASFNTFIGYQAGRANTSGQYNSFMGYNAGLSNTTGGTNVFIGNESGKTNTSGASNVFLGNLAGYSNNASNNAFIGNESGRNNTSGTNNAFIGYFAGRANISGANNVYLGNNSGLSSTSGTGNVAIGNNSASDVTSSLTSSVIIGENALTSMQTVIPVSSSLFIGKNAGINLGVGSTSVSNCVFLGTNAGDGIKNTQYLQIGDIVALGNSSGSNSDGYRNVFIGNGAGNGFVGHQNTMIGFFVGSQSGSGTYNVFLGDQCALNSIGDNNTYIGRTAGAWVRGDNNVFLGIDAGRASFGSPRTESQRLRIGASNLIYGEFDNQRVAINATNPTQTLDVNGNARIRSIGSGAYSGVVNRMADGTLTTSTSDVRLKENINTLTNSLSNVMKLRGVNFTWKKEPQMGLKIGFIAQEVEKVFPELVFTNEVDGYKGVNYAEMTAVLAEAIKEQQKIIEKQKEDFDALKAELEAIKALLKK